MHLLSFLQLDSHARAMLASQCVYNWLKHLVLQVNARKIYDEPNVLEGILANRLFLGILGAEFALQVTLLQVYQLLELYSMQTGLRSGHCDAVSD